MVFSRNAKPDVQVVVDPQQRMVLSWGTLQNEEKELVEEQDASQLEADKEEHPFFSGYGC